MSGSIFVVSEDNKILELKESKYENEAIFQELIEKYPNILAGDQISPDNPRKWIFIAREMGVPGEDGGNDRWFLDHLFIDQDAIPTFVEVKRSSDTRIRREVVGQMLDYAANAIKYWSIDTIRDLYEQQNKSICDELDIDEKSENLFWNNVESNLKEGKIRLLFVADEIPDSLKNIIQFLNNQMVNTEVLGVEIKQFESDRKIKTFVPTIIGKTSSSIAVKNKTSWTEEGFLMAVKDVDEELVDVCNVILAGFRSFGCEKNWGKGKKTPSFVPSYTKKQENRLFAVYAYPSSVKMEIYFKFYKEPYFNQDKKQEIKEKLNEIFEISLNDSDLLTRPSIYIDKLKDKDKMRYFLDYFKELVKGLKASPKN